MFSRTKGQTSIEYLLLIGGGVVIASIAIALLFTIGSGGTNITLGSYAQLQSSSVPINWKVVCTGQEVDENYTITLTPPEGKIFESFVEEVTHSSFAADACKPETAELDKNPPTRVMLLAKKNAINGCDGFVASAKSSTMNVNFDSPVSQSWTIYYGGSMSETGDNISFDVEAKDAVDFPNSLPPVEAIINQRVCVVWVDLN